MPKPENICQREGCGQWKSARFTNCTPLCASIEQELQRIEALLRRAGPGPLSAQCWGAAVSMADNYAQMQKLRRRLVRITKRQEAQRGDGTAGAQPETASDLLEPSPVSPISGPFPGG